MKPRRRPWRLLPPLLVFGFLLDAGHPLMADPVAVAADFTVPVDYPLVKDKFGVYNSGIVPVSHYQRDIHLFPEVRPESLRIDLGWGTRWAGWTEPPVAGTPGDLQFHFGEMDEIASLLNAQDVRPLWSYCYVPIPVQNPPGRYRNVPSDLPAWGTILGTFARHALQSRPPNPIGYHEVYNEPDNGDFFRGTETDYLAMYRQGALAIRAADPVAVVGGPALAFSDSWVDPFLDYVVRQRLPLDFFSFHFYPGVPYRERDIDGVIGMIRDHLDRHPELATTAMNLDEYNSYRIDYPEGGTQDRFGLASALLHDYRDFLAQPALTMVNWAQFMDSGYGNFSGMISLDGHRKAVFNAYKLYAEMPVDRRQVTFAGPAGIEGMASTDGHTAALLFWNRSGAPQTVTAALSHLPFSGGRFHVYRIDADHASWGDNPANEALLPVETHAVGPGKRLSWTGVVPDAAVVSLVADDGTDRSELAPNPVAVVLRTDHYYPDRAKTSYADFDRRTWTARLGMAQERRAAAVVGVLADRLPRVLEVSTQVEGALGRRDPDSLLGLRLDYQVNPGYTKSVLFHGSCVAGPDLYDPKRSAPMPWGTQRPADRVVRVTNLAHFQIRPAAFAPAHWSGRVQITFLLQNAGPHTRVKFTLRRGPGASTP